MKYKILNILEDCCSRCYDDLHFEKDRQYIASAIIESGNLIELPCKVGTTLFFIYNRPYADKPNLAPKIHETNNWYFDVCQKGIAISTRNPYGYNGEYFYYLDEMVFLTKAEAEKKLKELKNER